MSTRPSPLFRPVFRATPILRPSLRYADNYPSHLTAKILPKNSPRFVRLQLPQRQQDITLTDVGLLCTRIPGLKSFSPPRILDGRKTIFKFAQSKGRFPPSIRMSRKFLCNAAIYKGIRCDL